MEKYWSNLKDLEKGKSFSGHILDSKTRDYLNMNYSSPLSLPLPSHLERPPSPADAIERGCDFLTREYQKGFMPKFDADNYKKTLLRPALLARANHKMIKKQTQNFDLEKLYETEKYQKFWLTSDTVIKIKKEISKLPFISSLDIKVVIERFLELVASIVRTMKNKKMIENEDKQNKKQLRATMAHFINESKLARKKAFKYAFQQEFLDLDKLDDSYKEEFINDIPKYSRQQNRNISEDIKNFDCSMNEKTIEQYSLICENLPNAYKMTNYQMNEDQRSATRKELKKYINSLPQQLLNGMNQIELQKAQSEPIFNTTNFISDNENNFENQLVNFEPENISKPITNRSESQIKNDNNSDNDIFNSLYLKRSPTVITIPFENKKNIDFDKTEPISNSKSLTQQEIHYDYWNSFDPLDNVREGDSKFETISQIHKISSSFEMNYQNQQDIDASLPFKLEYEEIQEAKNQKISAESSRKRNKKEKKKKILSSNEKSDGPILIGDIWTTSDLLNNIGKSTNNKDEEEEEEEEDNDDSLNEISPSNEEIFNRQLTLESEKRKNDAMAFLKSFKFSKSSKKSSLIVSKLQEIWENLGFSVQQKISLLVKYTSSIEESQRLNEALNFWEMTFNIVLRYNDSYRELKDFIKIEAPTSKNARATCEMFKQQIENCEENVKQIAENLLLTFGDELIINRKTVQQIIPQRHKKMMEMISKYYND